MRGHENFHQFERGHMLKKFGNYCSRDKVTDNAVFTNLERIKIEPVSLLTHCVYKNRA